MPSSDFYTDHRQSRLYLQVSSQEEDPQTKLQVYKLRDPRVKSNLQVMERLHCVTAAEPEELWKQMKTVLPVSYTHLTLPTIRCV